MAVICTYHYHIFKVLTAASKCKPEGMLKDGEINSTAPTRL
jgi:hypothetical protein